MTCAQVSTLPGWPSPGSRAPVTPQSAATFVVPAYAPQCARQPPSNVAPKRPSPPG